MNIADGKHSLRKNTDNVIWTTITLPSRLKLVYMHNLAENNFSSYYDAVDVHTGRVDEKYCGWYCHGDLRYIEH